MCINWHNIFEGVISGIIGNLIFTGIAYFLIVTVFVPKFRKWHSFLDFLGINSNNRELNIYISSIKIKPEGGTMGVGNKDEQPNVGFTGLAITQSEYEAALLFQNEIRRYRPLFFYSKKFPWIGKLSFKRIETRIEPSPKVDDIDKESEKKYCELVDSQTSPNTVIIGSFIYNLLSHELRKQKVSLIKLDRSSKKENFQVCIKRNREDWIPVGKQIKKEDSNGLPCELGVVQRVKNKNGNTIILCAGTSANATLGTATFIVNQWKKICDHLKSADNNFGFFLEFKGIERDEKMTFSDDYIRDLSLYPDGFPQD